MMKQYSIVWAAVLLCMACGTASAQTQRPQRPVKNPPQYPHIIDLENKAPKQDPAKDKPAEPEEPAPVLSVELIRSIDALAGEVRQLVLEMRALNVRQQAQIDMLRLTRGDLRIDSYERDLKIVTDRLAQLEMDEQSLKAAMTPEALLTAVSRFGTLNRDETMQQIRRDYETRLRMIEGEKERLQQRESELRRIIGGFRENNEETEQKIKLVEEALRRLTSPAPDRKP
ncbi:MAG: hypothetical protein KF868_06225 [Acidobacteria bacterium]|nr:hypothetical protein [Acidobacteriota bacterium]